jgi:hypothetical protein
MSEIGGVYSQADSQDGPIFPTLTADATPLVIWRRTLRPGETVLFMLEVLGEKDDGVDRATYRRSFTGSRAAAAGAVLAGTATIGTDVETNAAWDVTLAASGNDITLAVTGAAATNIRWGGWVHAVSRSF